MPQCGRTLDRIGDAAGTAFSSPAMLAEVPLAGLCFCWIARKGGGVGVKNRLISRFLPFLPFEMLRDPDFSGRLSPVAVPLMLVMHLRAT